MRLLLVIVAVLVPHLLPAEAAGTTPRERVLLRQLLRTELGRQLALDHHRTEVETAVAKHIDEILVGRLGALPGLKQLFDREAGRGYGAFLAAMALAYAGDAHGQRMLSAICAEGPDAPFSTNSAFEKGVAGLALLALDVRPPPGFTFAKQAVAQFGALDALLPPAR